MLMVNFSFSRIAIQQISNMKLLLSNFWCELICSTKDLWTRHVISICLQYMLSSSSMFFPSFMSYSDFLIFLLSQLRLQGKQARANTHNINMFYASGDYITKNFNLIACSTGILILVRWCPPFTW